MAERVQPADLHICSVSAVTMVTLNVRSRPNTQRGFGLTESFSEQVRTDANGCRDSTSSGSLVRAQYRPSKSSAEGDLFRCSSLYGLARKALPRLFARRVEKLPRNAPGRCGPHFRAPGERASPRCAVWRSVAFVFVRRVQPRVRAANDRAPRACRGDRVWRAPPARSPRPPCRYP
jgi:hypothetical protein